MPKWHENAGPLRAPAKGWHWGEDAPFVETQYIYSDWHSGSQPGVGCGGGPDNDEIVVLFDAHDRPLVIRRERKVGFV